MGVNSGFLRNQKRFSYHAKIKVEFYNMTKYSAGILVYQNYENPDHEEVSI